MKTEGYALVNKKGEYLYLQQESSNDLELYTTDEPIRAELFKTKTEAIKVAKETNKKEGDWNIWCLEEDVPHAVVKVTILTHVEKVEKLAK